MRNTTAERMNIMLSLLLNKYIESERMIKDVSL